MPKLTISNKNNFKTTTSDGETIGKRIARYRKKRGLTQKELAEKIGIDRTVIANYELGRARIYDEIFLRLAIALNVSADILLGIKEIINKHNNPSLKIMRRVKKIEKLSPTQQKVILRNIDLTIAGFEQKISQK